MTFSFDGSQLASVLDDGRTIKLWDTTTGKCLNTEILDDDDRAVWIAFPCKSNTPIAVEVEAGRQGGEEPKAIVRFWDTASDRWDTVAPVDCAALISAAVFSPDGIWLAVADKAPDKGHIGIWDWARGDRTLRFPHGREPPHSMAYSPSRANLLASAHREEVCLWNPESGEALRSIRSMANDLTAFFFGGGRLVVANNASLRTWDPRTGGRLQTLEVTSHNDYSSPAALSGDGSRFVAAPDGNIRIWDVATRRRLGTLGGYYGEVLSLALSPDGARLASAGEGGIKVWDSSGGAEGEGGVSQASRDHGGVISVIAVAAGGTRMVSASQDAVKVWDTADGRCIWHLKPIDRDGSGGGDGRGGHGGADYVALSPDGSRLALMPVNGDKVQIWDLEKRERLNDIPYTALAPPSFSHDGTRVALVTQSHGLIRVRLWKFRGGGGGHAETPLKPNFDPKPLKPACVVFAPDGKRLAASVGDVMAVWAPISPETEPVQLPRRRADKTSTTTDTSTSGISSLCFSSDNEHIASSHKGGEIRIWSLQPATRIRTLQMPGGKGVDLVAFGINKVPTSAISTISKAACFGLGRAPSAAAARPFRLLTSVGVVTGDVMDSVSPSCGNEEGYGIDLDSGWITHGSERVMVLPPDHRPHCVAVVPAGPAWAPTVAAIVLGCRSGRVVSLCFPERTGL